MTNDTVKCVLESSRLSKGKIVRDIFSLKKFNMCENYYSVQMLSSLSSLGFDTKQF